MILLSEAGVLSDIRLEASESGMRLWRNNVGATYTSNGDFIRYGIANDSHKINTYIKSADLIGIKPIIITQKHIGCIIGQFISREIKKPGWKYSQTDKEKSQNNWAELIISLGGDACFAKGRGSL